MGTVKFARVGDYYKVFAWSSPCVMGFYYQELVAAGGS